MWSGVDNKKVRERERERERVADIPWFTRKANRVLFLGLALLHIGTRRPLEWVKAQSFRSPGNKVSSAGLRAPRN